MIFAFAIIATGLYVVVAPMLSDWSAFGFHDWGTHTAYRYITVISVGEYGEAPWWHPYMCGGVPAVGLHGGAPNFISPWLPLYLGLEIQHALRLELLLSALAGMVGAWLLAGRFTKSIALKTLVVVMFALNGRWALQAAVGHTWHHEYAWMPWAVYFFDRALEPGRARNVIGAGAFIALMAYHGAIYPAPHSALFLGMYAVVVAIARRELKPLGLLIVTGLIAFGLGAVKLFMVADALGQAHRKVTSDEIIGLREMLAMLTDSNQTYSSGPVSVPAYGWHEWGIYVGYGGLVVLLVGLLFGRTPRERGMAWVGGFFGLVGFGAFHPLSPWALLRKLPFFDNMHVPSRLLYPMVLALAVAFVAVVARRIDWRVQRRRWLDMVLLIPVALLAYDMVGVSRLPMHEAWWMELHPKYATRSTEPFEHTHRGAGARWQRNDWAVPIFPSILANRGVMECYGVPPSTKKGALARDRPGYRGSAYVAEGPGKVEVVDWSPNRAVVKLSGVPAGATVVYNMNWDPSWEANGEQAESYKDAVAVTAQEGVETVEFRYVPRTLKYSLPLVALTLTGMVAVPLIARRRRRVAAGEVPSPTSSDLS